MNDSHPRITVYGATGHTGTLVCRELARRERDFVASARNFEKLQRLSSHLGEAFDVVPTLRQASIDDWSSLASMLDATNILINCAGPFVEYGPPIVRAAVRNDVHYLDTTGEQEYIRWMEDELDVEASKRRLVLMPACAFEYATGTLAAALAVDQSVREVVASYGVAGFSTSAGTKRSIVRSIARDGVTFVDGRRKPHVSAERIYEVPTPGGGSHCGVWFAGGEPIFVPGFGDVDRAESCLRVGRTTARLLSAMSGGLSKLADWVEPVADRVIDVLHDERRRGEVDEGSSPFEVIAFDPGLEQWFAAISGSDPYPTTARIIVEAAHRIEARRELPGGLQSPPSVFDPTDFANSVGLDVRTADEACE